jgi:hypothetical protein
LCSAGSGLGHPILGIFKAQKLLDVAEANFQRPTSREGLQDLGGVESEIEGEEAIVAAAATWVPYDDDAQKLRSGVLAPV